MLLVVLRVLRVLLVLVVLLVVVLLVVLLELVVLRVLRLLLLVRILCRSRQSGQEPREEILLDIHGHVRPLKVHRQQSGILLPQLSPLLLPGCGSRRHRRHLDCHQHRLYRPCAGAAASALTSALVLAV
jgi:hypothetical protein